MSLLRTHMGLMFLYAAATAGFFTLLWKRDRREQLRFFAIVFCALFFGGIVLGWLMFPFPQK